MNALNYSRMGVAYNSENPQLNENVSKKAKLFSDFVFDYLAKSHRSDKYKALYRNMIEHVMRFCELNNIDQLYTNDIDAEFVEGFIDYLREERSLMQNTVKGQLERLRAMMHKVMLYGYPVNNTYKEIPMVVEEEAGATFLTMSEITRIYYYENLSKKMKEVRDFFIIGCMTGLRYSDYSRISEANIVYEQNQITMKTKKTGVPVIVPMHRYVREILKKYNYQLPKPRCTQQFNVSIKKICKKIGFTDPVIYERTVGVEVVHKIMQKWQVISSHTARRSFATNAFLQGIAPYRIMLITGHKSEMSFFKYVRITREENALTLSNHLFFQ